MITILSNITEFQKQKKELDQLISLRETLSQLDQICNYYYDAINDYHYFSSQILDMLKVKTENNNLTLSLKHYLQYVHPEDRDRVQEAFDL